MNMKIYRLFMIAGVVVAVTGLAMAHYGMVAVGSGIALAGASQRLALRLCRPFFDQ